MVSLAERTEDGAHAHVVQFYADTFELVAGAGSYVAEGLQAGGAALLIAGADHRDAFTAHLRDAGVDIDRGLGSGALTILDAEQTLEGFHRDGELDRSSFFAQVGAIVRGAAASGRPLRVYGEMVALLWEWGHVMAAIEVEAWWNELQDEVPFALYCAYPKVILRDEQASALEQVCTLHSAVVERPVLDATWHFEPDPDAPGEARRRLHASLSGAGLDGDVLYDAQLVVSELATNAVRHVGRPFAVSVRADGSRVRVLVEDRSPAMPLVQEAPRGASGRGLQLVSQLARDWGVDVRADGKLVWAELAPSEP